eukprot:TRINITY_DN111181_c0_g1_i1.p1 TRINITY_DN111181_c0_g1~~TRINITY_DN111181_c0_g1_i1.p1  ORF type:complete len:513 (+),score=82.81 TRINITY_DN111181_c0_g1_i1:99-1637(+)
MARVSFCVPADNRPMEPFRPSFGRAQTLDNRTLQSADLARRAQTPTPQQVAAQGSLPRSPLQLPLQNRHGYNQEAAAGVPSFCLDLPTSTVSHSSVGRRATLPASQFGGYGAADVPARSSALAPLSPTQAFRGPLSPTHANLGPLLTKPEIYTPKAASSSSTASTCTGSGSVEFSVLKPTGSESPKMFAQADRQASMARSPTLVCRSPSLICRGETSPLALTRGLGPRYSVATALSPMAMGRARTGSAVFGVDASAPFCMALDGHAQPGLQKVSVVAPGGGTKSNAAVYNALSKHGYSVETVGQSGARYDRYPESWAAPGSAPAPNLESFARELLAQGVVDTSQCLVVGSRGGQVVLPVLWEARGQDVPPTVVLNGGCGMPQLPKPVYWPMGAVSFLLVGGQDYFNGDLTGEQYLHACRSKVPLGNRSTAILLVNEMEHMPQSHLLMAILHHMIGCVVAWKTAKQLPMTAMEAILTALVGGGWSGRLMYTNDSGSWTDFEFSRTGVLLKGCN